MRKKTRLIDKRGGGGSDQALTAMASVHDTSDSIHHRTEIVIAALVHLTGRDSHTHRQRDRSLRVYGCRNCIVRRGKRRTYSITSVLKKPATVRLDGCAQHVIVS